MGKWLIVALLFFCCASPAVWAEETEELTLEEVIFGVLLGELALYEGNLPIALEMWSNLAENTADENALARATELAFHAQNWTLAQQLVNVWQQNNPQSIRAEEWALKILILQKENDSKLKDYLEKKLKTDSQNRAQILLNLPKILLENGQDKNEKKAMLWALTQPYLFLKEAHLSRAQMAMAINDFGLTEKALDEALKIDSTLEDAIILKSALYLEKNPQQSIHILKEFLQRNPQAEKVLLNYIRALIIAGNMQEALTIFKKIKIKEENIENLYALTLLTLQKGFYQEGKLLLNLLEKYKDINMNQIDYLKAQIAIEEKNNQNAIFYLEKVVRQNDVQQYLFARIQLAQLLAKEGKLSLARARLFSTQTENDSERIHLILAEAQILNESNLKKEAFLVLKNAVEKYPKNTDLKYELAMVADRLKDYSAMEKYLRLILKQDPNHAHALNALGYSFAERGIRLKEAEHLIQKSLKIEKENPYILDSLGWVYFKQGKWAESLQILQKAWTLKADAEIAAHCAEVLFLLGDKEKGDAILNEALEKNPNHPVLKEFLQRFPR